MFIYYVVVLIQIIVIQIIEHVLIFIHVSLELTLHVRPLGSRMFQMTAVYCKLFKFFNSTIFIILLTDRQKNRQLDR